MSRHLYKPLPAYMSHREGLFNPDIQIVSELAWIARVEGLQQLLHEQSLAPQSLPLTPPLERSPNLNLARPLERRFAFPPIKKEESQSLHLSPYQQFPIQVRFPGQPRLSELHPEPLPAQRLLSACQSATIRLSATIVSRSPSPFAASANSYTNSDANNELLTSLCTVGRNTAVASRNRKPEK
ncbi:hypothetical protein BDV95DRAFT_588727 [Massariosphaeria phaeospora]|uniref:Uncharacterized protein n=1 Tax=Massariosphaeria phaeospora TaxID=100035 RepID=A0A7C8I558_9PLEO|nr:hypothetical protein BDV95DRAFT_588727 [Massariosphaeria phaeospora]